MCSRCCARCAEGKEEEELAAQAKANTAGATAGQFDANAEKGSRARVLSIANPMNAVSRATGSRRSDTAAPLYFPGAKSTALRNHAGVKFKVYRVDSPEDISDPITIIFKLDLAAKQLRTSNPSAASQKVSRKYYPLKGLDIDLWSFDGKFGMSLIERVTKWGCCGTSGVERDYVFVDEEERMRFCSLIHALDDGVLPEGEIEKGEIVVKRHVDVRKRSSETCPGVARDAAWTGGSASFNNAIVSSSRTPAIEFGFQAVCGLLLCCPPGASC